MTLTLKHLAFYDFTPFCCMLLCFAFHFRAHSHCLLMDKYTSIKIQQKLASCDVQDKENNKRLKFSSTVVHIYLLNQILNEMKSPSVPEP